MTTDDDLQTTLHWPGEAPEVPDADLVPSGRGARTSPAEGGDRLDSPDRAGTAAADARAPAPPDDPGNAADRTAERLHEIERGMAALRGDLRDLHQVVLQLRDLADLAVARLEQQAARRPARPPAAASSGDLHAPDLAHEMAELREELARLRRRVPLRADPEPPDR